jgi:lipopolysaccharide/colanic/teichoic acid biosynthesis glycosyltransferase
MLDFQGERGPGDAADVDAASSMSERRATRSTTRESSWRVGGTSSSGEWLEVVRPIETVWNADMPREAEPPLVDAPPPRAELANRMVNIVIAAVALVVLSPVFFLVALAVRLSSRGPILYTQTRVGLDRRFGRIVALYDRRERNQGGRIFTIYKFRSMYTDAERHTGAVWATRHDPRITPVGRFLRAYRLDELPQLLNVVKGDMNIVGPRPERPSIFAKLSEDISEYPLRQRARPGITGWAQVNQSYDSCVEDVRAKVHYDLEYIARQSLVEDFRIMLKTVPVMLFRRGGW